MPAHNAPATQAIAVRRRSNGAVTARESRHFDRKLSEILSKAAALFCARGYHNSSIRDIARSTGVSLAGLYYYFSSKEELLYLIQRHAFETILARGRAALTPLTDPEERLRALVRVHLQFFIEHPNEMTVLTHEDNSLEDRWRREVHAIKKAYYQVCYDQVEALKNPLSLGSLNTRVAVLSLFGMVNWIYTWYRPKVDPDAETLAGQMTDIFLRGISGARTRGRAVGGLSRLASKGNGSRHNAAKSPSVQNRGGGFQSRTHKV